MTQVQEVSRSQDWFINRRESADKRVDQNLAKVQKRQAETMVKKTGRKVKKHEGKTRLED